VLHVPSTDRFFFPVLPTFYQGETRMKPERIQEPWADELGWRLEQKGDGQDTLCHTYDFEDPHQAFDFVSTLCQIAKVQQQNPSFRVRDGLVIVQCAVPDEGASEALRRFIRDLNDLRASLT
jgi:pterin-4a-carbinolamine dehydratase